MVDGEKLNFFFFTGLSGQQGLLCGAGWEENFLSQNSEVILPLDLKVLVEKFV